jgi:hypothetical protein
MTVIQLYKHNRKFTRRGLRNTQNPMYTNRVLLTFLQHFGVFCLSCFVILNGLDGSINGEGRLNFCEKQSASAIGNRACIRPQLGGGGVYL